MKLGVYIGSFDPVHEGHIAIINEVLKEQIVDQVFIIPTMNYWNKHLTLSLEERIKRLKIYEQTNITVKSEYSNCQYTYEVLRQIKRDFSDELYLIIGADTTKDFHKWKNIEEILKNKIIIVKREGYEINNLDLIKDPIIIDLHMPNISSTMIRNMKK